MMEAIVIRARSSACHRPYRTVAAIIIVIVIVPSLSFSPLSKKKRPFE